MKGPVLKFMHDTVGSMRWSVSVVYFNSARKLVSQTSQPALVN